MRAIKPFTFHRPALAESYCDSLEGLGLADSRSGLFLAAPRRTGKSTFLREDMLPAMQKRGWTTIYVDLWADKSKDPALLMTSAVKAKIATFAGVIAKMAKASGLEKVNVFGALSLNLDSLELPTGLTLADALEALVQAGKAPVAIVIDEAQHALSTQAGVDAMFALKAARDHLNQGAEQQGLFIVLTGSNRDKLAHLVLKRTQPFFGSQVTRFPLLTKEFTDAYTDFLNPLLANDNQFSHEEVFEAFKLVGHRPELLRSIVGEIALDAGAEHLGEALKNGAEENQGKECGQRWRASSPVCPTFSERCWIRSSRRAEISFPFPRRQCALMPTWCSKKEYRFHRSRPRWIHCVKRDWSGGRPMANMHLKMKAWPVGTKAR